MALKYQDAELEWRWSKCKWPRGVTSSRRRRRSQQILSSFSSGYDTAAVVIVINVRCQGTSIRTLYGHTYSKGKDQPGKIANPARGQLNRENEYCNTLNTAVVSSRCSCCLY